MNKYTCKDNILKNNYTNLYLLNQVLANQMDIQNILIIHLYILNNQIANLLLANKCNKNNIVVQMIKFRTLNFN